MVDLYGRGARLTTSERYGRAAVGIVQGAVSTTHPRVVGSTVTARRSRRKVSLRVSHPLRSTSAQAGPNCWRLYPVLGARPLTARAASCTCADEVGARGSVAAVGGSAMPDTGADPALEDAHDVSASASISPAATGRVDQGMEPPRLLE